MKPPYRVSKITGTPSYILNELRYKYHTSKKSHYNIVKNNLKDFNTKPALWQIIGPFYLIDNNDAWKKVSTTSLDKMVNFKILLAVFLWQVAMLCSVGVHTC